MLQEGLSDGLAVWGSMVKSSLRKSNGADHPNRIFDNV